MKYFEVVFYYFLPLPVGLLKKSFLTTKQAKKTQRTQSKNM
jgi:hypothetical protein